MPDEKQKPKFEGERSMLPFFLAGLPLAVMAYRHRGELGTIYQTAGSAAAAESQALNKVVGGRAASYFKALSAWKADPSALAPGMEPIVLEGFKRRLGPTGHAMHVHNLETAMDMVKGKPGLTAMLKQSFEEMAGVEAGAIGATPEALLAKIPGAVTQLKPSTMATILAEGSYSTKLAALDELLTTLMRPELKMGGAEAVRITGGLRDLAGAAERTFGHKPTFHLMMKGKDAAASEMMIRFPRARGEALEFALPLPTAEGIVMQPTGQAYGARRVLAGAGTYARQGGAPLDVSAPEAILERMRNIITQPTDVPMGTRLKELQQQVRGLLIWQGPETAAAAGVASPASALRGFTQQVAVNPWGELSYAENLQAMERLALEGRMAGLPPSAAAKSVAWGQAAAERMPSIMSPQHWGQAQTKGLPFNLPAEWEGAQLFQISPGGAQAAAERFGYGAVPRTDTIMMAEDTREALMGLQRGEIKIDPTLPAGRRLQRIQQMLMDHKATQDMLTGGSTVQEAIYEFQRRGAGMAPRANIAEMEQLLRLQQGEILGFTQAGAVRAETFGQKTFIRGFRTVGEETVIDVEARFPMTKTFSPGGVKHTVEYGERAAVREMAIYAKTEELLRAETGAGDPLISRALSERRRHEIARIQAQELWEGSQGVIVEGAPPWAPEAEQWGVWAKTEGQGKNVARFNQLMMERLETEGVEIPAKMAALENLEMQRKQIEALARARGFDPGIMFHPAMMARRVEQLRLGPAVGVQGFGRTGTFSDDVFNLFKSFGMTSVAEDIEARVIADVPVQRLMETTFRAVRAGETALPGAVPYEEWAEMVFPKGEGMAGTIFDPMVRAEMQARGGILRLPQPYTVGGAKVQHLPIPELESGYAGYFQTQTGQVMQKDLDVALRNVMESTVMDVGMVETPGVAPVAQEALEEYFALIDKIRLTNRNLIGGKVAGSRIMRAGKWLDEPEMILGEAGEELAVPRVKITRSTFARMLKERVRKGLIKDMTAEELVNAFKAGRYPGTIVKHPALGPLSAMPAFFGPATHAGAEHDVAYVDAILHRAMNIDLDQDPLHTDMATTRASFDETTRALETGQVGRKIQLHEQLSEAMAGGSPAEASVIRKDPIPLWLKGKINPDILREQAFRKMSSQADIGIFHTMVAQPIAQTARELGVGWEDVFITNLWRQAVEEGSAIKIEKATEMPAQLSRQVADAFRTGRLDRLMNLTQDILQMEPGEAKMMFDDVISRMGTGYASLSNEKRTYIEALYASQSKASARNLMAVADGTVGATMAGESAAKAEIGGAGRVTTTMGRMLGRAQQFVKGHKKGVVLTLAASAALGLIAARPRDLTPDAVESGQLAGGQIQGIGTTTPMGGLSKNLHYRESSQPGFRVRANLNKLVDHEHLANKASQMTGNKSVRVNVSDRRRRITREQIELAMRDDRILGATKAPSGFYNNYRG